MKKENINILKKLSSSKKIKKIIIIGSFIFVIVASGSIFCYKTSEMKNLTYNGIYLEEHSVGKLNKDTLESKVVSILDNKIKNSFIDIKIGNDTIKVNYSELGVYYNIDEITNDILKIKKHDNNILATLNRLSLLIKHYTYTPTFKINEEILSNYLSQLDKDYSKEAVNAQISINNSKLTATSEKDGEKLDIEKLKKDITSNIQQDLKESTITASFNTVKAVLDKETAEQMVILGSYKTPLLNKNKDRTNNIKLFFEKINLTIIAPNEEFSCNKTAGSRTIADGYRAAPGYVNGKVVPIVAGGICQGTSTIYNAILYADLEIIERHPHSMPVTYVSNGRDAAIAGSLKDLRFKNNTNNPIIINTYVTSDGYVATNIWGIKEDKTKKIEISVKHINSKAADAYKKTYLGEKLVKTELLSRDRYK